MYPPQGNHTAFFFGEKKIKSFIEEKLRLYIFVFKTFKEVPIRKSGGRIFFILRRGRRFCTAFQSQDVSFKRETPLCFIHQSKADRVGNLISEFSLMFAEEKML
jgi:hypothetical protein